MYDNPIHSGAGIASADYAAKERAAQEYARDNAQGIQRGTIGNGPQPSMAETITRELEKVLSLLHETAQIQENQRDRLFGPRPENPNSGHNKASMSGAAAAIEERLQALQIVSQRIYTNACEFNRVV